MKKSALWLLRGLSLVVISFVFIVFIFNPNQTEPFLDSKRRR